MSKVSILTSLLVLTGFAFVGGEAQATKLNAAPLPTERELKDFEASQGVQPQVSRFSRRLDYREEERLRKEEAERARNDAAAQTVKARAMQMQNQQKNIKQALEANNRGVLMGKAGRWTEAIAAAEEAVAHDPSNKQYVINLSAARCTYGQERMAAKDYNAAAGLFRKSLAAASDNSLANKLLSEAMKKLGQDPAAPEDRIAIGEQLAAVGDFESARVEFQAALQMNPKSGHCLTKMGDMYYKAGQIQASAHFYQQAIAADKDYAPAYRQLGLLQAAAKDYTGAATNLRQAVIRDAKDAIAGTSLVEIWRRQVAANPLLAENHLGLAGALQLTGDFNGAEAEYNKLQALDANHPALAAGRNSLNRGRAHAAAEKHRMAAETLFNQGLRREALAEISQAVMAEPKNSRYQFLLGECLEANGDLRGAHQAYLTAVLIDPEQNKEAAYRMKEMQRGNSLANQPAPMQQQPQAMPQMQAPVQMPMQQQAPVQATQVPPTFRKNMYEGVAPQNTSTPMPMSFAMHDEPRMPAAVAAPVQTPAAVQQAPAQQQAPVAAQAAPASDPAVNDAFAKATDFEAQRNYAGAIAVLRAVMTTHLQDAEIHHRLAVDLLASGEIADSITEFRIASALRPANKAYSDDLARAMTIHKRSVQNTEVTNETVPPASGKEVAAK